MKSEMTLATVVIIARQFNPSSFSHYWLIKNGILREEDFPPGWVYSPVFVDVAPKEFHLVVLPEQLQFAPIPPTEASQELLASKVGRIVETLPHTPYVAAGLNFHWQVAHETKSVAEVGRRAFFKTETPLFRHFNSDDARFGAYMSRDVLGCRLRLDIKPVTVTRAETSQGRLQFSFNFHGDLSGENKVERILDLLAKWSEAWNLANTILASFDEKEP
jgi:hypothetical protein